MPSLEMRRVEQTWRNRLEQAHGLNLSDPKDLKRARTTARFLQLQLEFFAGAMAYRQATYPDEAPPAGWVLMLASGRSII